MTSALWIVFWGGVFVGGIVIVILDMIFFDEGMRKALIDEIRHMRKENKSNKQEPK